MEKKTTTTTTTTKSPTIEEKPEDKAIRPDVALKQFLTEFGTPAEKSLRRTLDAISETEKSLVTIHAWDRSQGLRKCHSRTVVKTRRSRAKLKAFLMGVDPPREPTKKRKKAKGKVVSAREVVEVEFDALQ
ncbi:hypothetical protein ACHAXR_008829 [Thalassiosira sp. AJA248-18]